jgi:cell wall assembly regulator SMI1
LQKLFKQFEEWLQENYKEGINDLNSPITDQEIIELEKGLGFSVAKDLIEILKIHNGQKGNASWLFEGQEFLSSHRILEEWKVWQNLLDSGDFDDNISDEVDSVIKNNWWNSMWVPFTYDGMGNHYCIDMNPTELGDKGQIITVWHDTAERKLLNSSFYLWFESYITKLIAGDFIYSKKYDSIVNKNEV